MGRHVQYADLSLGRVPQAHAPAHRGAQPMPSATFRPTGCACICAGATIPVRIIATCRSATSSTWSRRQSLRAILFEAANPRHAHEWRIFETIKPPEGKVLIPGVIECQSNYHRTSRIGRAAHRALREPGGRENMIAGVDCGFGTWSDRAASILMSCGRNLPHSPKARGSQASGSGLNSPLTKSSSADSVLSSRHNGNQRWRWGDQRLFRMI